MVGNAFRALGMDDDDSGDLWIPPSLDLPFALRSSAANLVPWGLGPSSSDTVGAGLFVFVHTISGTGAAAVCTVTPSGGAAININALTAGACNPHRIGLCLGAGDSISTGAGMYLGGYRLSASAIFGSPTRILGIVDNTPTSISVGASEAALITHCWATTGATLIPVSLGGAWRAAQAIYGTTLDYQGVMVPQLVTAGLSITSGSATDVLISGLRRSL